MKYTYIFVVICLICIQAYPMLNLTKACLFVVDWKHTKFAVLRNISRTLQLDLNAHNTKSVLSQPQLMCLFGNKVKILQQCVK
jgi:hypothetical protein